MRSVVCVKWGSKYPADYVNRLYNMVQRNLNLDHEFICLTDDSTDIDKKIIIKPLTENLKYAYSKFELFVTDIQGEILFLDLDVVIIDSIDDLFLHEPSAEFVSIKDWDMDSINASCMRFNSKKFSFITYNWLNAVKSRFQEEVFIDQATKEENLLYHDLVSFPPEVHRGDQEWTTNQLREQNIPITYYPSDWLQSYKFGFDMNAKIIIFHGLPKPHQVKDKWVTMHWK